MKRLFMLSALFLASVYFIALSLLPKNLLAQGYVPVPYTHLVAGGPNCSGCTLLQAVTSSGSGTSHPESFTSGTTLNSLIVVFTSHNSWSGSGTSSATDANGNTYHPCSGTGTGSFTDVHILTTYGMGCMWAINTGGTGTDTVTLVPTDCASSCSDVGNVIMEFSGVSTTPSVAWDAWGSQASTTTSGTGANNMSCGALTASQANDLIVCALNAASGTASGGTSPINFGTLDIPGSANAAAEHAVYSGSGSVTPTMHLDTGSVNYGGIVLAFK